MRDEGPRTTRDGWLDQGLEILSAEGDGGLTVDALCARMHRTKGSFYHHFAGREDFVGRLLEHWEQTFTRRVIEDLEPILDPRERLLALGQLTAHEVDLRLERTIRIWGEREPEARRVLERVDRARESYLVEQFEAASGDRHSARLAARTHMALLVGTQMLYQDLSQRELLQLSAFVDHLGLAPGRPPRDLDTEDTP